eukprot:CAMPEP_0170464076 /NCGR_PEP_ID=MMETSP0123-20130129/8943_1 /TAXON_ID=182087 /ORGANISM="Favella ehrenbergii, Strain Fehren 1" /LENGTH=75 /DNA_ID=CAMNT_0010729657 /DNA_START=166 /DNA_END=393 /DNA_ORIENTATION=-
MPSMLMNCTVPSDLLVDPPTGGDMPMSGMNMSLLLNCTYPMPEPFDFMNATNATNSTNSTGPMGASQATDSMYYL